MSVDLQRAFMLCHDFNFHNINGTSRKINKLKITPTTIQVYVKDRSNDRFYVYLIDVRSGDITTFLESTLSSQDDLLVKIPLKDGPTWSSMNVLSSKDIDALSDDQAYPLMGYDELIEELNK